MEIAGKKVFVTGANRGLGRALALACLRAGAREVVAAARRPEALSDLEADAGALASRITKVRLDLTSDREVEAAAALGRVDVLINNAGVCARGGVLAGKLKDLQHEIEVNYIGLIRMVRAFAPAMAKHGDGLIVNVASQLGKVSLPLLGTYCATKAALLSITQALRGDLAPHGVRVIAVCPGTLDTDMSRGFEVPKLAPEKAAEEILQAIRAETLEAPIGDEARRTFAGLTADPLAVEKALAPIRAEWL